MNKTLQELISLLQEKLPTDVLAEALVLLAELVPMVAQDATAHDPKNGQFTSGGGGASSGGNLQTNPLHDPLNVNQWHVDNLNKKVQAYQAENGGKVMPAAHPVRKEIERHQKERREIILANYAKQHSVA